MTKPTTAVMFVLHRNHTVTSTMGHAIEFKKGQPTSVPREAFKDVQAVGAVPADELDEVELPKVEEVLDPEDRKAMIFAAMEQLVTKGDRESFTGSGSPHAKAVSELAGFTVNAEERDAMWLAFRQANAGNE